MMDCTSSSCASRALHFTTEGSGSFGPAAGCSEADGGFDVTPPGPCDWTGALEDAAWSKNVDDAGSPSLHNLHPSTGVVTAEC